MYPHYFALDSFFHPLNLKGHRNLSRRSAEPPASHPQGANLNLDQVHDMLSDNYNEELRECYGMMVVEQKKGFVAAFWHDNTKRTYEVIAANTVFYFLSQDINLP